MIKRKLYTTPEVIVTKFEVNKNMMASLTPETTASPDGPGDTETRDWFSPPEVTGGTVSYTHLILIWQVQTTTDFMVYL